MSTYSYSELEYKSSTLSHGNVLTHNEPEYMLPALASMAPHLQTHGQYCIKAQHMSRM